MRDLRGVLLHVGHALFDDFLGHFVYLGGAFKEDSDLVPARREPSWGELGDDGGVRFAQKVADLLVEARLDQLEEGHVLVVRVDFGVLDVVELDPQRRLADHVGGQVLEPAPHILDRPQRCELVQQRLRALLDHWDHAHDILHAESRDVCSSLSLPVHSFCRKQSGRACFYSCQLKCRVSNKVMRSSPQHILDIIRVPQHNNQPPE
mmetsp:Transcript_107991/g.161552  ORF Transcript_107991/g.161552 Transcript_107991/m.161552 type:complete len:206 (+) Transcript_107991:703-1320(+)